MGNDNVTGTPRTVRVIESLSAANDGYNMNMDEIKNFVQRDMLCSDLGFDEGQTPFEDHTVISFGDIINDMCCSTGDNFVSSEQDDWVITDVVDMEAYAIAKACKQSSVEFRCFKYVSDLADENASTEWSKTVANGEQEYIKIFQQIVGGF